MYYGHLNSLGRNFMGSRYINPLSLSPALWLDASDSSTLYDSTVGGSLVAADGAVARWEDKSGNGRHATQSTGVSQPLRKTAVQNGKDVVRFDGANDYLWANPATCDQVSVFVVFKPNTTDAIQIFIQWSGGADPLTRRRIHFWTNGSEAACYFGDSGAQLMEAKQNGSIATEWQLGAAVFNSTPRYYKNGQGGTSVASNGVLNSGANKYGIGVKVDSAGNNYGGESFFLNGDIAEILVFPTALSDTDRASVEAYLNAKWAIY